jgi:phosphate transport system permease protein
MPKKLRVGRKTVRRSVLIADKIADQTIKVGGVLVIAAVLGILVFLVYEILPLFKSGQVESRFSFPVKTSPRGVIAVAVDEYKCLVITISRDGSTTAFHSRTGTPIALGNFDFQGKEVTASVQTVDANHLAFGFADGTVRFVRLVMNAEVLPAAQRRKGLKKLDARDSTDGSSIYSKIPGDQIRKVTAKVETSNEIRVSDTGSPIVALDYRVGSSSDNPSKTFVAIDGAGVASLNRTTSKENLLTGKMTEKVSRVVLPAPPGGALINRALLTEGGADVYLASNSGRLYRYNSRDSRVPKLTEIVELLPSGTELTALRLLLGDQSIVVGGSDGSLSIYFRVRQEHTGTSDGYGLVKARVFEPDDDAVTLIEPGRRGRTFATANRTGDIRLRHGTSLKTLMRMESGDDAAPVRALGLAPRVNGMVAVRDNGEATFWDLDVSHPETSLATLFGKVWYEGYPEPTYTWQSSAATDDFEPKLSLIPLIFGTLKATFYSLLFAIPVALLAAIYTSEFVNTSVRATVKPIMEMMASLPSVILGFVAALVLAPIVESWIAAILLSFLVLPLSLILASFLWQLLPTHLALRLQGLPKLALIFLVVLSACAASFGVGSLFEALFFGGNFKAWVNGDIGKSTPFLFILLMPVVAIAVTVSLSRLFGRRLNRLVGQSSAFAASVIQMGRWVILIVCSTGLAWAISVFLQSFGVDVRGGFVGTYVQRNTLIVGFAMGFAVIPIIYTLAEDALNAVPEHLRSASLGCGATPWQTAIWVILPAAVSGVFSAIMIGMGRAVGETMIVVMAAGNTPLIDLNIFNGLRALSANIAVELPEAVKDDSLYRVLFLTALVLFGMTFVINTVAEVVRLRFRKKTMQL